MYKIISAISVLFSIMLITAAALAAAVPMVGDKAPDFTLTSVKGEKIALSQYRGSVVVLGLFHICDPCMNQATQMQHLLNEGQTKAVFLGVNTAGDTKDDILSYLSRFKTKITFPYLPDPAQDVNRKYFHRLMPTVLIIDGDGIIRYRGTATPSNVLLSEIRKITLK